MPYGNPGPASQPVPVGKIVGWGAVALVIFVALSLGAVSGCKSFNRYQKRADANNAVKVTHIRIRQAQQQAQIVNAQIAATKAKANQRYFAAIGIRRAQDEVQKTLTPLYVQFEAIEAQKAIATSGRNNTVIYVPSGTNGTPVITQNSRP